MSYADYVIKVLLGRGGFDEWWDMLTPDIQQDIKDEINRRILDAEARR